VDESHGGAIPGKRAIRARPQRCLWTELLDSSTDEAIKEDGREIKSGIVARPMKTSIESNALAQRFIAKNGPPRQQSIGEMAQAGLIGGETGRPDWTIRT